jgi:hypothetical protein
VADLGFGHETGYTRHSLKAKVGNPVVNRHMRGGFEPKMYPMVAPREHLSDVNF